MNNHLHSLKAILNRTFTQIEVEVEVEVHVKIVVVKDNITIIKTSSNQLMTCSSVTQVEEDTLEEGGEVMAIGNNNKMIKDVTTMVNLAIQKWAILRSKMI